MDKKAKVVDVNKVEYKGRKVLLCERSLPYALVSSDDWEDALLYWCVEALSLCVGLRSEPLMRMCSWLVYGSTCLGEEPALRVGVSDIAASREDKRGEP